MKKNIFMIILISIIGFIGIDKIYAGNLSINGSSSVYVNSSINVTVNFSNIAGRFRIYSSDSSILSGGAEDFYDNQSTTLTFAALKAGTVTVTVSPIGKVGDYDNEEYTGGSRSITVKVVNRNTTPSIDVNRTYNSNNYLNGLSIEGYEFEPAFNKDTLEYSVTLNPGTEKINISASTEDRTASIKGIGEVSVSEGVNALNIIVTAENGNERTYNIFATVEEKDPIEVTINGKKYRVVKKDQLINDKNGYERSSVKIKEFDIPTLYNEVTKITLVALKDEEGNISLFTYDSKNGEYGLYNEVDFDLVSLQIIENDNSKYDKTNLKINGKEVIGYKLEGITDYYLLYAINISTGNKGYYLYDVKENTVQRYSTMMLDKITKEKDKYLSLVIVLSSVCFLTMLFLLIEVNKENKKKNED